jgi:hypothetical protein
MDKVIKVINEPALLIKKFLNLKISRIIPDKLYLKIKYRIRMGKKLDLTNPRTFNEKLQWLKLNDRKREYTKMVDKYEVRKYISDLIGEKYLIPIIGVYNNFEEIDFESLPNQFVLKCTHDSGGIVICKDKKALSIEDARNQINYSLNRNYYFLSREWPYKNVKPRIICEKYMVDESGTELKDYKIFCFDGTPKIIEVDYNRFNGHKRNIYDTNWKYLPFSIEYPTDPNTEINRPSKLDEMLEISKKLSKGFHHLRVDLYLIKGEIYFGEVTFYHEAGMAKFHPHEFEMQMGSWINIS